MLYGTQGGTARGFAEQLAFACRAALGSAEVRCVDLAQYEPECLLSEAPGTAVLVVVSTYENGTPPAGARWFCR